MFCAFVHLKTILNPVKKPKDFINTVLVLDQTLTESQRVLDLAIVQGKKKNRQRA